MKRLPMLLAPMLLVLAAGCDGSLASATLASDGGVLTADAGNAATHEEATDDTWAEGDVVELTLLGTSVALSANAAGRASVTGTVVTISAAGPYRLSGTLEGGQVVVNAPDAVVTLILSGAHLTGSGTSAPLLVEDAQKTVVIIDEGTQNSFSGDPADGVADTEDAPNAVLFSRDDLSIYGAGAGTGTLTITARANDGIASKNGLVIAGAQLAVTAADDGIRGKDYLVVRGSTLVITAGGDGLKSDEDEDVTLGFITLESGDVTIVSAGDGVDAQTRLAILDGTYRVTTGGGSTATLAADVSAKGLKGVGAVRVEGGAFVLDTADDAVHSNELVQLDDGRFSISAADDGVHADLQLIVNGGTLEISRCYEGLESAAITFAGGVASITASDDGVNVAGGNDGSSTLPGHPSSSASGNLFTMTGGTIAVSSAGDGIDVNGSVVMTGGTIIVDGPTANDNGALDYDGTFLISGGTVLAVGSSGMAMAPSATSSQRSLMVTYGTSGGTGPGGPGGPGTSTASLPAGTLVHLETSSGELFTFRPAKAWQSVVYSSPTLSAGMSVSLSTGGASSGGIEAHGLITGGTYSGGTLETTFSLTGIVTSATFN